MTSQGDLRKALLDAAGESTREDLDTEITPLYISLTEGILLNLLSDINAANGTRHFIRPADNRDDWYRYTTRNRQWRLGTVVDASLDASSDHVTAIDGWRVSADTVINQQKATVDLPEFPRAPIKVWEYAQLPPLPVTVKNGAALTIRATFSDYVLSCPDAVITSTGDALTITLLNHGYDADLTLTSAGTTQITKFELWGRQAVRQPEQSHLAQDTLSEALPRGVRAGPDISGDFVGPFDAAIGISEHIVWRYGSPKKRPQLVATNWYTGLAHDLYDVFEVTSVQLKATDIAFEVVGLDETWHNAAADDSGNPTAVFWETTYQLQERVVHAAFFTLDSSLLDGDDQLAY